MKTFITQILIFATGCSLLIADNSGGYFNQMTALSYGGMILCGLGIGFQWILGLFKKKS